MQIIIFALLISFGAVFSCLIDEKLTTMTATKCRQFRLVGVLLIFFGMCYGMQSLLDAGILTR